MNSENEQMIANFNVISIIIEYALYIKTSLIDRVFHREAIPLPAIPLPHLLPILTHAKPSAAKFTIFYYKIRVMP